MNDVIELPAGKTPDELAALKNVTMVVYVLQGLSFLWGLTAIVGLIINYVKRDDVRGTWLESHFRWQIRTFWFTFLGLVFYGLLVITIIGIPLAWMLIAILGLWVGYRVIRGWVALFGIKPVGN